MLLWRFLTPRKYPSGLTQEIGKAPVRGCHHYLTHRLKHLDYPAALEAGLPIGSGEVESAHRYVIQERLKIAGAWWKEEQAHDMLALRVCRANHDWEAYWSQIAQEAA